MNLATNSDLIELQNAISAVVTCTSSQRCTEYLRLGFTSPSGLVAVRFLSDRKIQIDVNTAGTKSKAYQAAKLASEVARKFGWE